MTAIIASTENVVGNLLIFIIQSLQLKLNLLCFRRKSRMAWVFFSEKACFPG